MRRQAKIETQYRSQVGQAARRFRDHEDMNAGIVSRWLSCFADEDLELGVKILENIQYYPGRQIRQMANSLVSMVYRNLGNLAKGKIYFVPVGGLGGGSAVLARALHDNTAIPKGRIKHMIEIEPIPPDDIQAIVFVDDFSGTGDTLLKWWLTVEPLVLPKDVKVVVGLLVMNQRARSKIETFARALLSVTELTDEHNVLSQFSSAFQQAEKESLRSYCASTGCSHEYVEGYGGCGLLVAFKHLCPNNSLPILWAQTPRWQRLFRRRAL